MLKTVKVKKNLRLDELIKYVWDNHLFPETFKSNFNDFAHFDKTGKYQLIEQRGINQATKFTVEVEEEITEDTVFEDITVVFKINSRDETGHFYNSTLKDIKKAKKILSAYIPIDGKLELIYERNWERDEE